MNRCILMIFMAFGFISMVSSDPVQKYKEVLELFAMDQNKSYADLLSLLEELRPENDYRKYYLVCLATKVKMLIDMSRYQAAAEAEENFYQELQGEKDRILVFSNCWPALLHDADKYLRAGHKEFAVSALRPFIRHLDEIVNGKYSSTFAAMNPQGFKYLDRQLVNARAFLAYLYFLRGDHKEAQQAVLAEEVADSPLGQLTIYLLREASEESAQEVGSDNQELLLLSAMAGNPHAWRELMKQSTEKSLLWGEIFKRHYQSGVVDLRIGFMPPHSADLSGLSIADAKDKEADMADYSEEAMVLWEEIAAVIKSNSVI